MSSFTGVSVITDGNLCTTSAIDAGTDSGYHLLVVKDYPRTVEEIPKGKNIRSGPFMIGGHKWRIWYYPNGDELSLADNISFCISLDDGMEEAVKAKVMFSFVDQVEMQKPKYIRANETFSLSSKHFTWCHFKRSAHLKKADSFTTGVTSWFAMISTPRMPVAPCLTYASILKFYYQDKVGSDVTLEVSGETFPAHRCVLAARSEVFKAQLFGPMTEGITPSVIQIKDMDAKSVCSFA